MKTEIFKNFEILTKKSGFLDSDDNARGSRIAITVVCPISDVQLKIPRKLFKLPVNSAEFHLKTSMSGSFMLVSSSGCVN